MYIYDISSLRVKVQFCGIWGRDADTSPPSSAMVKKARAIPLLPIWAVRSVQSLSACTEPQCLYKGALFCGISYYSVML